MNNRKKLLLIFLFVFHSTSGFPEQSGTASWYSEKSCKKEGTSGVWTASGERFNEEAMTCALRSHDFGGLYKICNENDSCIIVRHNDFGPNKKLYKKGRIIDLSKGAFRKLASLKKGVINVTVEKINEED